MIFYILSIKQDNKIAFCVGWKICSCYLVVTFLRVRCSLYGQCRIAVVARTPRPQKRHHQISTVDLPANMQDNFIIMVSIQYINITSEFYLYNIFYIVGRVAQSV